MPRPDLELLSPARTADIGIEAVNHGADAVYIGGPAFGARDKASNPVADIERLARHAHLYGARIFVTLNTILRDDELEAARRVAWQVYEAGADALIVQDMGLLALDLPPIQLHASTQTDIRTPAKARFLQDVGFSQMVLARELDLGQIRAVAARVDRATLEFFIHGALCVAYSGQCYLSHAQTGRSANRGDCSQPCRLPYTVTDAAGGVIAHEKHVLSMKDNDQSANLRALVDAGVRSFKIEGRYKDMGFVKNITAHYRRLFDEILAERPDLRPASAGRVTLHFTPDPNRNFNRESTDYFVTGRKMDIGAFDTPKHAGLPLGEVHRVAPTHLEVLADSPLHNGDGIAWFDLQQELHGVRVNVASRLPDVDGRPCWRVETLEPVAGLKHLKRGTALHRNRDMGWDRLLERKSAERHLPVTMRFTDTPDGFALTVSDTDGHVAHAAAAHAHEPARDAARAEGALREALARLGGTPFVAHRIDIACAQPWFVPASLANALRRDAVQALAEARAAALPRLPRAAPVEPPVPYPEDTLSYLGNVFNEAAARFYARHAVQHIAPAYESHEESGEVSLMITKHCVRWSLSLCPKQAKGVTGVQGTVRAEPLVMMNGTERLTLTFDCKPCEMHVLGRLKRHVVQQAAREAAAAPIRFYRSRPAASRG